MSFKNHHAFQSWQYSDFRFFSVARLALTMGIMMQSVLNGYIVYDFTKDPWSLGLLGLAEAIPAITVGLYAGYAADKYNRKNIILIFIGLMIAASCVLTYFNFNTDVIFSNYGVMPYYIFTAVIGVCRGFLASSITAFGAQLVPRELYANMASWNSSLWYMGAISGPAIGGFIFDAKGAGVSSMCYTVLMAVAFLSYIFIPSKPVAKDFKAEKIWDSLKEGIRFVRYNPILLAALSLDLFAVLLGDAIVLLPAFAKEVLFTDAHGVGILRAAPAVGACFMAVYLAFHPPLKNTGKKLLISVACFGLCMIGFALSKNFMLTFFILALGGMFDNISVVIRHTILQTATPDEMRGRVSAINSIFIGSSNEIGSFVSGGMAKLLGLIPSVIVGGCLTLGVVGAASKLSPELREFEMEKK